MRWAVLIAFWPLGVFAQAGFLQDTNICDVEVSNAYGESVEVRSGVGPVAVVDLSHSVRVAIPAGEYHVADASGTVGSSFTLSAGRWFVGVRGASGSGTVSAYPVDVDPVGAQAYRYYWASRGFMIMSTFFLLGLMIRVVKLIQGRVTAANEV